MASTPFDVVLPSRSASTMSSSSDRVSYFPTPLTSVCVTPQCNHSIPTTALVAIQHLDLNFTFEVPYQHYHYATRTIQKFINTLSLDVSSSTLSLLELSSRFLTFASNLDSNRNSCDFGVLRSAFTEFERMFLKDSDIHALTTSEEIIRSYYAARIVNSHLSDDTFCPSALLRAVDSGKATLYAIFGGQGNTDVYFEELRNVHRIYTPIIDEFVTTSAATLLAISRNAQDRQLISSTIDIRKWLQAPETTPEDALMISSPISFPLIGLLQLSHFAVTCKILGMTPGQVRGYISGITGHSQGIVSAVVIASADSWDSFYSLANMALVTLFWIGCRSQQIYPKTVLSPEIIHDSVEGLPSPMLSVRDMPMPLLQKHIDTVNKYLGADEQIAISLINNPRNVVVAGPPMSLYGLNLRLRQAKASQGEDQSKILYSRRKAAFLSSFLPITAPFHSKFLANAAVQVYSDVLAENVQLLAEGLRIPVYHTSTGDDLSRSSGDLIPALIRMILEEPVDWAKATVFPGATHIIDFGPGSLSGVGVLTSRSKEGTGIRVILADKVSGSNPEVGYKSELVGLECPVKFGANWEEEYAPRLFTSCTQEILLDTKLSRLLNLPPVIIGGMTPSTVPWDFVAATMNAGYHIELAGGGYHNAKALEVALTKLQSAIPKGRGITINLIYANPQAIAWQIPLIKSLCARGMPIDGLTFGAGVPSPDVATEFFKMGLKHISFKPGSIAAIESVLDIAKAHPRFPIILQWTGGRAGGHHGFEDFHEPIAKTYAKIRRHSNIILVAGSGFGGWEDTYPYLTGKWSTSERYGYPPMPFDGCLLGSRIMVAKEAHTSRATQKAITETPGLQDGDWEEASSGLSGAGGIITVISEMGEPIHMLATRGARFWAEMDNMVFSLPNDRRSAVLKSKRAYIIEKLNADFHKVWFGRNMAGQAIDLEQMTYGEVIQRLVEMLFIPRKGIFQWIDDSHGKFVVDFVRRVEERFIVKAGLPIISQKSFIDDPHASIANLFKDYPRANQRIIIAEDVQFFLHLCQRRGRKPVPFIPTLDDNFQVYFKKDSLWQSEDLEAVVGQDVGRVCILQGPVAVQHSTIIGEPVGQILDSINNGHIKCLRRDLYGDDDDAIPKIQDYDAGNSQYQIDSLDIRGTVVQEQEEYVSYHILGTTEDDLPSSESLFRLLAGNRLSWRHALFTSERFMYGSRFQPNCIRSLISPVIGLVIEIQRPNEPFRTQITVKEPSSSDEEKFLTTIKIEMCDENEILVRLIHHDTASGFPTELLLRFSYHQGIATPIREILEDRNQRIKDFYWRTWFGESDERRVLSPRVSTIDDSLSEDTTSSCELFASQEYTVTRSSIRTFVHSIANGSENFLGRGGRSLVAPMDYSIVAAWKATMKPLFAINGDLLKLVHLSNQFKTLSISTPLKEGEKVTSTARVNAILIQESGKVVEVITIISRLGKPVLEIASRFLYRGDYNDFDSCFQNRQEAPMKLELATNKDVAIIKSKPWFRSFDPIERFDLLGRTLIFRLSSTYRFKNSSSFSGLETWGEVFLKSAAMELPIGKVEFAAGSCSGNPVMSYLQRHGAPIEQAVQLRNPVQIQANSELLHRFTTPSSNKAYSYASGDFNPIHTSKVISKYSNLPGTITHGMFVGASVRKVLDDNFVGSVSRFATSFVGMILPGDEITVAVQHTAMIQGRKLLKIEARRASTDELVLTGEAEVEQASSAYIFTGQGSQSKGMGMDLYETSAAARDVWNRADEYFRSNYGFAITDIIKKDPKELTIHFGGPLGKRLRRNYLSLTHESVSPTTGAVTETRIFKEITPRSTSYTFRSPIGLLSATQFTQPALTVMAIARFSDLTSKGLIQEGASFAGHSLGEYAALSALGGIMPIEKLVAITWVRGLTMQLGVERDATGRSDFSMCAVNPSKVSIRSPNGGKFGEQELRQIVRGIVEMTGWLLEIVNFNIEELQYICAGDVKALDCLAGVLNALIAKSTPFSELSAEGIFDITKCCVEETKVKPVPLQTKRGPATVPLPQIDVPFHSSFLAGGVDTYRRFLETKIERDEIDPEKLVGSWIPNLTGKPFGIERGDFEEVHEITGSKRIAEILRKWDEFEKRRMTEM